MAALSVRQPLQTSLLLVCPAQRRRNAPNCQSFVSRHFIPADISSIREFLDEIFSLARLRFSTVNAPAARRPSLWATNTVKRNSPNF